MKSSTIGRLFLGSLTFASALAVGNEARGADTTVAAASNTNAPTFGEISVGRLTTPPAKNVGGVPGGSTVPGIYVVKPNFGGGGGMQQVMITADEKMAAQYKSQQGFSRGEETPSACVSESHRNVFNAFNGPEGKQNEWSETMSGETTAYPKTADNPMSGVVAVHSERVVENGNTATLESVDAWVDPATRGAKLIGKSSLPLKLVRGPGFGLKIWAGRDERPDGKRFVQFIVSRPKSNPGDTVSRTSQMWTMRQDGNITHASGCGHMRVALPLDAVSKDGKNGEMATVVATVMLPPLDNDSPSTPTPAAAAAAPVAPPPPPPPQVTFVKGKPVSKKPSPGNSVAPAAFFPNGPNSDGTRKEHEVRSRMVHVQVSVSQMSKEKEPLVSVSSTWGGREQVDRVADMANGVPTTDLSPF